ncbi:uncharacterized protein LOC131649326 [Vicia villosa]|uniref:uncharacterized protein LOC131649326 n=1 Tax=Vicia villosa TaxID=3911 RepID=UPI00273A7C69|nr:uncharacterized protein LOC131649326 [Vicia villosa]
MQDKLIWHHEKDSNYSVRSAYHCCMNRKFANLPGPSVNPYQKLWKSIWRAPVHPRVRNFVWRLAKNILPTKDNLQKKGIALDGSCTMCSVAEESAHHLFMECPFAKQVLFSSILSCRIPCDVAVPYWLMEILSCGDSLHIQVVCVSLHNIWNARNQRLYQQKIVSPLRVMENVCFLVEEFNCRNVDTETNHDSSRAHSDVVLPTDLITAQVDAGVFQDGSVSFGCVLRNQRAEIILAASKKDFITVPPNVAELLAIRWCLGIASALKVDRILVQSDAKSVIDCINGSVIDAVLEPVAEDCRWLLNRFNLAYVMFLSRELTVDAHNLVRLGNLYGSKTWIGGFPLVDSTVTAASVS